MGACRATASRSPWRGRRCSPPFCPPAVIVTPSASLRACLLPYLLRCCATTAAAVHLLVVSNDWTHRNLRLGRCCARLCWTLHDRHRRYDVRPPKEGRALSVSVQPPAMSIPSLSPATSSASGCYCCQIQPFYTTYCTPCPLHPATTPWLHAAGPSVIGVMALTQCLLALFIDSFAAGCVCRPAQVWKLELERGQTAADFDRAVAHGDAVYRQRMHNLFCDNCHSHVACCLNEMSRHPPPPVQPRRSHDIQPRHAPARMAGCDF
jgi:hypothetical protein